MDRGTRNYLGGSCFLSMSKYQGFVPPCAMRNRIDANFFLTTSILYRKNVSFDRLAITSFSRAPEVRENFGHHF